MVIKGYICGFYELFRYTLKEKGEELSYLGEVHADKQLIE